MVAYAGDMPVKSIETSNHIKNMEEAFDGHDAIR